MRLFVRIIEARGLTPAYSNGLCDPYVKVQLGKHRSKTKVVNKSINPFWDEEFDFKVGDLNEEVQVYVLNDDKCIGHVKVSLSLLFDAKNFSLGTAWYQLRAKRKMTKHRVCGEICLAIGFSQKKLKNDEISMNQQVSPDDLTSGSEKSTEISREQCSSFSISKVESCADSSISGTEETDLVVEDKSSAASFVGVIWQVLGRKTEESFQINGDLCCFESQDTIMKPELYANQDNLHADVTFDELLKAMQSKDQACEIPEVLSGGVLINQSYMTTPCNLNFLLFSPGSEFAQSMAVLQGTTDLKIEDWKIENGVSNVKRFLTYRKAASKLVKALRANEEQVYLKADGNCFAVLASVSVPDAPFGSNFKTEILYSITPGPELPFDEQSSHLLISWRINFFQSTIMKGLIENGAKQGLNENFGLFAGTLSKNVKPLEIDGGDSNKNQILASLQTEPESFWKLLNQFYGNYTVMFFVIMALCVLIHILMASHSVVQGHEFFGLDLPDTIGEVLVCIFLVVQGQSIMNMTRRFLDALKLRGNNQGVKLEEGGWLLTVALIEGRSIASLGSSGLLSDPYVVFTCNGQKRTSSIKFQTLNPVWNEALGFHAMHDPPSRMDVVVYDFHGPFDEAIYLGHTEINFLKSNLSVLSDVWVPLHGNFVQACQSKLHLRIFLNNSKGNEVVMEYLTKIEKKVGKKISLRSSQTNSSFQKLFILPPEEFLIDDFTCQLKRKMPLQGRLFLSQRIFGFYANIFGNKTKFFFLWDDIEDIQVVPPSLASVGSPSVLIILRKGRGNDAKDGAKGIDQKGRLKFHFQSFVSFNAANRTIMALWKTRTLNLEQQWKIEDVKSKIECFQLHANESVSCMNELKMSEVFSSSLSISTNLLMVAFEGGSLELRTVEKLGRLDYSATPWEEVKPKVHQRRISYRIDKSKFHYEGEVTSSQKKYPLPDGNGWLIEESMSLSGVLLSDYFNLQLTYQIESIPSKPMACNVQVSIGIVWLKNTKHQRRIIKSVTSNSGLRLKEMFRQVEKELLSEK